MSEESKKDILKKLRIGQNFQDKVGVARKIVSIPFRKPDRQEFIRVHPSEDFRVDLAMLSVSEGGKQVDYVLNPDLVGEVVDARPTKVALAVSKLGAYFLWPIKISDYDNSWTSSALAAMESGIDNWIRVYSNRDANAYDVLVLQVPAPEPEWPKESFEDLIGLAIRSRYIDSLDHPVLKRLRGEA